VFPFGTERVIGGCWRPGSPNPTRCLEVAPNPVRLTNGANCNRNPAGCARGGWDSYSGACGRRALAQTPPKFLVPPGGSRLRREGGHFLNCSHPMCKTLCMVCGSPTDRIWGVPDGWGRRSSDYKGHSRRLSFRAAILGRRIHSRRHIVRALSFGYRYGCRRL
jgi:hypothetical protein